MTIIFLRHLKQADSNICHKGGRKWFKSNGLDWNDFVENGIDSKKLYNVSDSIVEKIIKVAESEKN